ncbi:MAG: hypothetical protein PVH00_15115 [Gemmatimonadota bacterium]|jgi:hypothetical protein
MPEHRTGSNVDSYGRTVVPQRNTDAMQILDTNVAAVTGTAGTSGS